MNWFKSFWKKPAPAKNNFTPRAAQVLALARREAQHLNHGYTDTEHVLLGLASLGDGLSFALLKANGLDLENAREKIQNLVPAGTDQTPAISIPFAPRVKKALALALREAKSFNHDFIGTEHILLGLLREGGGVAAPLLQKHNLNLETVRKEFMKHLEASPPSTDAPKPIEPPSEKPPESPIA